MSNYVQTTFFTPKDSLPPSNPAKTIFGAAYDVEFGNISSAIASKYDSSSISAGPIAFALGSAAAPSVTFLGELGTGLYSNVSGDLGHATAGTARLTISGSTGLTTALAGLTVSGGTTTTAALSSTTGNFSQNVVIAAPSSGTALAVTSVSTSPGITVTGPGTVPLTLQELAAAPTSVLGAFVGIGTAAFPGGSGINGDLVLIPRTSNANSILFATGNGTAAVRMSIGSAGNVTITAPSSGVPLALNTSASGSNFLTVSDGTQSGAILSQSGSIQFGALSNSALYLFSNNTNRVQIASTGAVTINTPSSGNTLTATSAANGVAGVFQGSSSSGQSYGLEINAGTTSADYAFYVTNQPNNTVYARIYGDGGMILGAPTGSTQGTGTLNATGLYINGGPVYSGIPQNSQSASYVTVLADANKHIYHPTTDNNARTFTIAANSSVAYPIGTAITFDNDVNVVTLAINTDTLVWLPTGATGSRSIAAQGQGTALKVTATRWHLTGVGIT